MKKVIVSLKNQHAEKSDLLKAIEQIPDALLSLNIDYQSFFEQILLHIRGYTIEYSSRKKRNRVHKQKEIEEKMNTIRNNEYVTNNNEFILLQNQLKSIRNELMKGLMVRARAKWIEEGETPTKYFLALEKRTYINKTISKIANDSGVLITNQQETLNEIKYFYQTLYSNKDNDLNDVDIEEIIDKSLVNILDSNMHEKLKGKNTYTEAL